jgi:hypothetical protein
MASSRFNSMSPPQWAHSPKLPCVIRFRASIRLLMVCRATSALCASVCLSILSRSLVSGVRLPRRVRPRLLLCICEDSLEFCDTPFQIFLELLEFLGRKQAADPDRVSDIILPEVLGVLVSPDHDRAIMPETGRLGDTHDASCRFAESDSVSP